MSVSESDKWDIQGFDAVHGLWLPPSHRHYTRAFAVFQPFLAEHPDWKDR
jgi:hypothetical protein